MSTEDIEKERSKMEMLIGKIQDDLDELRGFVYLRRNCPSCDLWDQPKAICGKYKTLPPPHVIVEGCDEFKNHIPF